MHAATNIAAKADGRVVPWNKGKLIGPEATAEAEGNLGHPDSTAIASSSP